MSIQITSVSPQFQKTAVFTTNVDDQLRLAKKLLTEGKTVNYVSSTTGLAEEKILEMQISIVPLYNPSSLRNFSG